MTKRFITFILSVVLILSLAACKGAKERETTTAPTTKTPTAEAPTTAAPATTVPPTKAGPAIDSTKQYSLIIGLPGSYNVTSKEIFESFQSKYPNIELIIQSEEWHPFTMSIELKLESEVGPDVWLQENASILGFAQKGFIEDLAPYIERDLNAEDYIDTLYAAKAGDKIYGVPHGSNPIALAYNKKIFDDAGEPYPSDNWTYDDMIAAAQRLTSRKSPDAPSTDIYGYISSPNMTQGWFPWIKSTGGSCLDETGTKATMTDPKTIQGIKNWVNNFLELKVSPSRLSDSKQVFGEQRAAMYFMQYSEAAYLNSKKFLDYDTVMIPKASDGNRYVINVCNTWAINAAAPEESKEAAWLFIYHYLSEASQDIVAASGGTLPIRISSLAKLDTGTKPANKAAFAKGVEEGGTTMDENATWDKWRRVVNTGLEAVFDGTVTAEDACANIQQGVQAILDGE